MKVFIINGSPKDKRSNTYRLTEAFLEGMGDIQAREASVSRLDIRPCLGCFSCWNKTPGQCVHRDDMATVMENMLWADVILWSFPLYYFSVPGPLKNLMDRQLPMVLPFMSRDTEAGGHPSRYDMSGKRHVVISTCGFYTAKGNYDGVNAVFDHLCGKEGYTALYCGQGELFRVKELSGRTEEYLTHVKAAGREFVDGGISRETRAYLDAPLFPREAFEAMADASWGIEQTGAPSDETLVFTRQMAALYNRKSWPGKDIVLEMDYTDVNRRCQILLTRSGSEVITDDFREYTTRIETPFTVWKAIASGEISGQEALAQQKYRVKGDFDLMIHWDRYFGPEKPTVVAQASPKTNMNLLLLPWITFWIAASIDSFYGALVSVVAAVLVPLLYRKNAATFYDQLSTVLVVMCSVGLLLKASPRIMVPLSYFGFGLMWSLSCLRPVPLTAYYSMNDYNGEEALKNPLFLKTNRILTACWGVLYLLTPIWTYFIMGSGAAAWTGAINSVLPMLMGAFTAWFQKWYPARIAWGCVRR